MRKNFKFFFYLLVGMAVSIAHAGSYEDFFRAIKTDDAKTIEALLQRGFDPNALDPSGRPGLFIALQEGSLKVAQALAEFPRTKVEWRNAKDESPLMIAALRGHTQMVRKLIARDADVNKTGWTPLHYAATGGHLEIMTLLLEESAYIDAESPNKTTPLMMAAQYGTPQAVKLLLDAGADPTLRNERGLTALDFARRGSRPDAVQMLTAAIRSTQPKGKW